MGRASIPPAAPDLFSTTLPPSKPSPSAPRQVGSAQERRHVLPKDLPNAVKHLSDQELDLLIAAALEEAKQRGRLAATAQATESVLKRSPRANDKQQGEATVSLTRGQINAVRAAFKAGIKPSLIGRQFGVSQSDVRKVLASDATTKKEGA
jgi:hypothetical protein